MSQHDYNIADQPGASFLADLNAALEAIATLNAGTSAPSPSYPYQLWADTWTGKLKIRNGANSAWFDAGWLNQPNLGFQPANAFLTQLAGVIPIPDQMLYIDGSTQIQMTPLSGFMRTLLDDPNATTARATLNAATATAALNALGSVSPATDSFAYFTGASTASTTPLSAYMRTLLDDPDAATARATLGVPNIGHFVNQVPTATTFLTLTGLSNVNWIEFSASFQGSSGNSGYPIIQIGNSSGFVTSGYFGASSAASGFDIITLSNSAGALIPSGWSNMLFSLTARLQRNYDNWWSISLVGANSNGQVAFFGSCRVQCVNADRMRFGAQNGTDTFTGNFAIVRGLG
jgi:hypothetical protein